MNLRSPLLSLAVIFAVAVALRFPVANMPLERDEGEYAYIAERWLAGDVPYKESFDQKPPGAFLAFALLIRTIGTSPAALHWGAQLYSLVTLTLIYLLGRCLFNARAGFIAAVLCAFLCTDASVLGSAANTETFMLLPLVAGTLTVWLAVESSSARWAIVTGLCAGGALLCKQVALFVVVFWLAWLLLRSPRRWTLSVLLLAGLVTPLLLVALYFWAVGGWGDFYDCVIGYNLSYASRVPLAEYPGRLWPQLMKMLRPFWPVGVLAAIGLICPRGGRPAPTLFIGLGLFATFLLAATGGRFFAHYFIPMLPSFALLAAVGLIRLTDRLSGDRLRLVAPILITTGIILFGVLMSPWYYLSRDDAEKCRRNYGPFNIFAESLPLSTFVADYTQPDDTIFVAGSEPQIYYYAQRKSASRYMFVYPILTPFPGTRDRQQAVLEELRDKRPALILTIPMQTSLSIFPNAPRDFLDGIDQLVDSDYEVTALVPFKDGKNGEMLTGEDAVRFYQEKPIRLGSVSNNLAATRASVIVWSRRSSGR